MLKIKSSGVEGKDFEVYGEQRKGEKKIVLVKVDLELVVFKEV